MPIDVSALYRRPQPPTATSQFMGNVGDIMTAMMARRQRQAELDQEAEQKAAELQFRQGQEARLTHRQEALDQRQVANDERDQRQKGYEAVAKAKPGDRPFMAQLYGGTAAPAKPDYSAGPDDPLGTLPMLDNVEDDPSSPLGFSYGMNPEHEARTRAAQGKQVITMPGGDPIEMESAPQADHYAKIRQTLQSLPDGPDKILALQRLAQAEGGDLNGEKSLEFIDKGRTMSQAAELARERLAAQKRRGAGKGGLSASKELNAQLLSEGKYDGIVQKVLQNKGYKEVNTSAVKMGDMLTTIAGASDNAALAAIGGGQFVKMAQGGTGVISDSDMRVFWQRIGGLGVRGEQAFNDAMSGKLGDDKRKAVMAAVQEMESKARSNMAAVGESIASRLEGVPGGREQIPTYLKTYAPDYLPAWQQKQGQGVPKMLAPADDERLRRMGH